MSWWTQRFGNIVLPEAEFRKADESPPAKRAPNFSDQLNEIISDAEHEHDQEITEQAEHWGGIIKGEALNAAKQRVRRCTVQIPYAEYSNDLLEAIQFWGKIEGLEITRQDFSQVLGGMPWLAGAGTPTGLYQQVQDMGVMLEITWA